MTSVSSHQKILNALEYDTFIVTLHSIGLYIHYTFPLSPLKVVREKERKKKRKREMKLNCGQDCQSVLDTDSRNSGQAH